MSVDLGKDTEKIREEEEELVMKIKCYKIG